jgi:DNA primase
MNLSKQRLSIEEVRQTDIVDYLSKLGYKPAKVRNTDYWYLSPLREEKTPSFKVNKKLNRWYDHGIGKGGNIIDFAIQYHHCTVGEFLFSFSNNFSFHRPLLSQSQKQQNESEEGKIKVIKEGPISSLTLIRYLQQRRIPLEVAECFCKEVKYELNNKEYFAIGFKNNAGGYEIRNPYFKGCSSPKDISTFSNGAKDAAVFEGFTDLLSFITIHQNQQQVLLDFVVLNSVSFFDRARSIMEDHESIMLYLDRDATGQNYSQYALSLSNKYKDESYLYKQYKDLNDWLVHFGKSQKKNVGHKL